MLTSPFRIDVEFEFYTGTNWPSPRVRGVIRYHCRDIGTPQDLVPDFNMMVSTGVASFDCDIEHWPTLGMLLWNGLKLLPDLEVNWILITTRGERIPTDPCQFMPASTPPRCQRRITLEEE